MMKKNIRVLIADDRPHSRAGLRALLATMPLFDLVAEASNGQDAVRFVEEYLPDVVLMDIRMEGMDGLAATRLIKKHWPEVRVIVLTMYESYQEQARIVGADDFLVKGCSTDELVNAILNYGGSDSKE